MLAKLLCTKRKSASAPRCLRCLGATIDIVNSITRTANRSGQGGIFASMFTKGQHRGHGDHWAWRLTGNYCENYYFSTKEKVRMERRKRYATAILQRRNGYAFTLFPALFLMIRHYPLV